MMSISKKTKFFMTIDTSVYKKIKKLSIKRGISTQEFIRAIIIPEWIENTNQQK